MAFWADFRRGIPQYKPPVQKTRQSSVLDIALIVPILLITDISSYQSPETTLSAVALSLFPKHDGEYRKLLVYVPKNRRPWLIKQWRIYEEIFDSFNQFGEFGVVMTEMPHPDFGSTPEAALLVERKRKIQVVNVFNEILEKL